MAMLSVFLADLRTAGDGHWPLWNFILCNGAANQRNWNSHCPGRTTPSSGEPDLRENAWIAAGGALAGLVVALFTLRALASFLYGISTHDPWVMMFSLLLLEAVASAASLIPAIRASRIEPITAIGCE